jgi:alpha-1,3-rhamnosyl/mannosyltransferase
MATTNPSPSREPGPRPATTAPSPPGSRAAAKPAGGLARQLWRAGRRFASPRRLVATAAFVASVVRQVRRRRAEPRLTVAVDVDSLYETLTGVGWYVHEILAHLAQRDDLRLRLYGQRLAALDVVAPPLPLPGGPALEHVTYSAPDGLVVPPWRADQLLRRAAPLFAAADGNAVLFGPNFLLPPLFRFARGARVATIHDLTFRRLPWAVRPDTGRALREQLERTLLEAELLLTPSAAVADELVSGGVPRSRVRAIHHGPGQRPPATVAAAASPPAGTPARYGLCVGTLEPRKNLVTLVDAWRRLRRSAGAAGTAGTANPRDPRRSADTGGALPLLVCGPQGWRAGALRRALAAAEREGWLRYLGYVTSAELLALYRGAAVVALPSLYEGFGLPAVEAMAAGAPLVLSDLPVFHEVAGDAALYAAADRPDEWCDRLRRVLDDDALRQEMVRRGTARAAAFDWRQAADAIADAFRLAAGANL